MDKRLFICQGRIEVMKISTIEQKLWLVAHIDCPPEELQLPATQILIQRGVGLAQNYLQAEGFLPNQLSTWTTHVNANNHFKG